MSTIQNVIQKIIEKENLTAKEMREVMCDIMKGETDPIQLSAFLIGMRMKEETIEELTAAVQVLREFVTPIKIAAFPLVDIVGTGGDALHTFNISTTCAFVVAAAGGYVAKLGNRSVSSSSGSADVLEKARVQLTLPPEKIAACVEQTGVGFIFAAHHHSAMKHTLAVRKALGIRTFFNLIGPLTNPAGVTNQLLGVFSREWVLPMAEVCRQLGSNHVLVVHGEDGMDEISIAAPTFVAELKENQIKTYETSPEQFGMQRSSLSHLRVNSVEESLTMMISVLDNESSPARDIVALNAGAAIYTAGLSADLFAGVARALEVIASGAAKEKFKALIEFSQR